MNEETKKHTVIYHSADFDGLFCREIARKFLGDGASGTGDDVNYIGWNHGDALIPFPSEGAVYVLDLSPECFESVPPHQERLIWIDHHKSSIEKFNPDIPGYRIDGVAACRLAWQWFAIAAQMENGQTPCTDGLPGIFDFKERRVVEPLAVRLAGEYDIWDKRDERAELFQHGLRSCDLSGYWPNLLRDDEETVAALLERGEALEYAQTQQNESIIKAYGFTVKFEGLTFLACNHARFNSHLFTAGIQPEHDALLGFNYDGQKKDWRISLYYAPGKEQHDLSQIAVKYGGGGHRGACGFRVENIGKILHGTF